MSRFLLTLAALVGMSAAGAASPAPVPASNQPSTPTGGPVVPPRAPAYVRKCCGPRGAPHADARERVRLEKQARHWAIIMERRAARAARRSAS